MRVWPAGSEIWLFRSRDLGFLIVIVLEPVFGADSFRPFVGAAPISYARGPGHREDARILDGEAELEVLAPIVAVDAHRGALILFCVPFQAFFRVLVVK